MAASDGYYYYGDTTGAPTIPIPDLPTGPDYSGPIIRGTSGAPLWSVPAAQPSRVFRPGNPPGVTRPSNRRMPPPMALPVDEYQPHPGYSPDMYGPTAPDEYRPHPGYSPDMYGPGPTEPVPELGPGGTYTDTGGVTSREIPAPAEAPLTPPRGMMAQPQQSTMAPPPASRRFSSTRPEFIYTNPAAAQQAAANYQARLGFETQQDQGYRDYLARLNSEQGANERYGQGLEAQAREGAAQRATTEKVAGLQESVRQKNVLRAQYIQDRRANEIGKQTAAMLNADPNAKVDNARNYVFKNAAGLWEPRIPEPTDPDAPIGTAGGPIRALPVAAPAPAAGPRVVVPVGRTAPAQVAVPEPTAPSRGFNWSTFPYY